MSNENVNIAFKPVNNLERLLFAAQKGELLLTDFMPKLLESQIYIPSTEEVQPNGKGLQPLFFDRQGNSMVAVFTDLSRITDEFKTHAKYCLCIVTKELLAGFPKDFGIVINPGHRVGIEIPPDGIDKLKNAI